MATPSGCTCKTCKNKKYFCRNCGSRIVYGTNREWYHSDPNSPEIPRDRTCQQMLAEPDDRSL